MAKPKGKTKIKIGDQEFSIRFNDDRGVFECSVSFPGQNGTVKRRTFRDRSQEDLAEQVKQAQMHQADASGDLNPKTLTLRQFVKYWLDDVKKIDLRQTTWETYEGHFRVHILPELGDVLLKDLTTEQLQRFFNKKYEDGSRKDGKKGCLSINSILDLRKVLTAALNDAVKLSKIDRNPMIPVKFRRESTSTGKPLTEESLAKLYQAAKYDRLFPALLLEFGTGLRRGELLGLRWKNVDMERGFITIAEQLVRTRSGVIKLQEPKTKTSTRTLPLPREVWQALVAHQASQADEKVLWGDDYEDNGFVFSELKGQPILPDKFYKHFAKWVKAAGLPHMRFHDLRHTHATQMIALGIHVKTLQERLGHADFNTTYNRYAHVLESMQQEASNKASELFANIEKMRAEATNAPTPISVDIQLSSEVVAATTEKETQK